MKWEYFVAPLLEHNPGEILNNFGEDGWELVTILQQQTPAGGVSMVAYMKRQVVLASARGGMFRIDHVVLAVRDLEASAETPLGGARPSVLPGRASSSVGDRQHDRAARERLHRALGRRRHVDAEHGVRRSIGHAAAAASSASAGRTLPSPLVPPSRRCWRAPPRPDRWAER